MSNQSTCIIGGGIGGLTLAIALRKQGINARIYEATAAFRKVGAGIMIANNAMQVFKQLGIAHQVEKAGYPIKKMIVGNQTGGILSQLDVSDYHKKFEVCNTAIHRAALHDVLLQQLPESSIQTDKRLASIQETEHIISLYFEDGSEIQTDILIGADGIHSKVREHLFPHSEERQAKQICWRGVAPFTLPVQYQQVLSELWGAGRRFGFVQISPTHSYWFACANYKKDLDEFEHIHLTDYFDKFPNVVKDLIAATSTDKIIINELSDLKPLADFYKGNICLMGDAAHATTPNMGQGACQAIESAWVLAQQIALATSPKQAFSQYQQIRKKRAQNIVKTSWQIGKLAHWNSALARGFRNSLMRLTPQHITNQQTRKLYEIELT